MARTTATVEDPDLVEKKSVDKSGRLYLGADFKDTEVRVVVERMDRDEDNEPDESAFAREIDRRSGWGEDDDYAADPDWHEDLEDLGENA